MFSKLALVATTAFAVLAVAIPTAPNNQCQTGEQQCCQSVQNAGSAEAEKAIALLGIKVPADANVGLTCTPLTVIGITNGCQQTQQPVCCNGNNFNGVVVIGCSPISV